MTMESILPIQLVVPSHPRFMTIVRHAAYSMATFAGFSNPEAKKIVLAVDEATTNIIKYSYDMDYTREIRFAFHVRADGLEIRIRDFGRPIDPKALKPRDLEEVRPGGLGIHFILNIMSDVRYHAHPEGGTELTMLKLRSDTPAIAH